MACRLDRACDLVAGLRRPAIRSRGDLPDGDRLDRGPRSKSIQTRRYDDGVLFLTYVRPIDYFVWTYRCRIEGNRIVWASDPGRWRDDPKDDRIFFEVVGTSTQLRIIESNVDGSATKQLFDRDMIQ